MCALLWLSFFGDWLRWFCVCAIFDTPSSPVSLVFTVSSSGTSSLEDRSASSPLVCRMITCSSAIRLIQSGSPSILTPPRFRLSSENSYNITIIICCLWTVGCLYWMYSKQIMTVGFFFNKERYQIYFVFK